MKKCLFCAEEIQDEAVKCRFCGEMLDKEKRKEKLTKQCSHCGTENSIDAFRCKNEDCSTLFSEIKGEYVPIGVSDKKASQELISYLVKKRKEDRSNTQGVGCLLVILGGLLAVILGPFGGLLALIGLVILIVGLVR